jgi:hypothetical protein
LKTKIAIFLILLFLAGDKALGAPPDSVPPSISYIKFNGKNISNDDYVNPNVTITAKIIDNETGIDTTKTVLVVDEIQSVKFSSYNNNLIYKASFTDGAHSVRIVAFDLAGNFINSDTIKFKVAAEAAKITDGVLCYKNPFNPGIGETTRITYTLNADADVNIYIYNLVGQLLKKISCPAGDEGGRADYNQPTWDGYTDFKELVGNDVYLIRVVSGGQVIGKCKLAVLK